MSFRDDREALSAKVSSLQGEVDRLRADLTAALEKAARADALEVRVRELEDAASRSWTARVEEAESGSTRGPAGRARRDGTEEPPAVPNKAQAEHDIPYDDQCRASYGPREYVVQYQETDLAFVLRLMQYEGIHFHVRQDDGGDVLVLGDGNDAFSALPDGEQLRYVAGHGRADDGGRVVSSLERVRSPRAAMVVLRDYDWRLPRAPLRATASADEATGAGIWDLFGEHWHGDAEGRRLAEVRAEEHAQHGDVFRGATHARAMRPGHVFELAEHPNPDLNRRYVVVETALAAGAPTHFTAVPYEVVVRPERSVPWPRVEGIVTALVDGESRSTATPIDDAGRYRVVMPLDAAAQTGGRATRWVRRAQPYSGEGYGMHMPLHIGTEVAVGHVNGDPDRPVILGAVPNAATASPVTNQNATASVIRSGSGIVIELEDDA